MAEMRTTAFAAHLGSDHPVGAVLDQFDGVSGLGLEEARPATPRFELRGRVEQFGAACRAVVRAVGMLVDVLPAPRAFSAGAAEHFVLFGTQGCAPFGVASFDLSHTARLNQTAHHVTSSQPW